MLSMANETHNYDNEIAFCAVYSQKDKKEIEKIFLKHRISYYIDWQKSSIFQKIFGGKNASDKINCLIRINRSDVEKAFLLVKDMKNVKFKDTVGNTERRAVTKRALMEAEEKAEEAVEDLDD